MCVSKVQHMTGWKTGWNRSRPLFSVFQFSTNLTTGNQKISEFVQLQLVVQSFAVGFSSILVFFSVQWTGPANTNNNAEEVVAEAELSKFTIHLESCWWILTKLLPVHLIKDWTLPIYTFFGPIPDITSNAEGHCTHEFCCLAGVCKGKCTNKQIVWCYLDTLDQTLSSSLKQHVVLCWGGETVTKALDAKVDIELACKILGGHQDSSITAAFEHKGKGKVLYSICQHTKAKA